MWLTDKKRINKCSLVDTTADEVFKSLDNMLHCYWWDETLNFGDWIGPWIVSYKSGRSVVNTRHIGVEGTLFTVGSILHHAPDMSTNITVWGSGLIKPIKGRWVRKFKNSNSNIEFLAVRGRLTRFELITKANMTIPEIYGDPALLLPRYFNPAKIKKYKTVLCPHQEHYRFIKTKFSQYEDITVIDVKTDPRDVVTIIANAEVCVSSSLHGLIIAQAYGVPWTWLYLEDHKLAGDTFKFYDFYSTLNNCDKGHVESCLLEELEYTNILRSVDKAKLFELSVDIDLLDESFPYSKNVRQSL